MKTAFPSLNQPVTITLFANVPFDNTYKDHSFISKKFKRKMSISAPTNYIGANTSQDRFLYRKNALGQNIYPHWTLTGTFNFDYKNGLVAIVYLELTSEQTNSNYMKVECGTDSYYYFITSINQNNYGTFQLGLELDVIMTYGDEFIEGLHLIPAFTKRKHCKRKYGNYVFSTDYKNGDSAFSNVSPSIVEDVIITDLKLNNKLSYIDSTCKIKRLDDILWLYVVTDLIPQDYGVLNNYTNYRINEISNPFSVLCIPLNCIVRIGHNTLSDNYLIGLSNQTEIQKLIEEGHYKSAKISSYPPFAELSGNVNLRLINEGRTDGKDTLYITDVSPSDNKIVYTSFNYGLFYANNNVIGFGDKFYDLNADASTEENKKFANWFVITREKDIEHVFKDTTYQDFSLTTDITSTRAKEPKLLFKPFRKYVITSAGSEEQEFYPELLCSVSGFKVDGTTINLATIVTNYGGDYTFFTYVKEVELLNSKVGFKGYKPAKIGLSTTTNYTIPVGTNALDVFKATQSQTYYQSKIASGITSGLTIAGGIGLTALGISAAVASKGSATPIAKGMIASGISTMASGTASMIDTIKSTNAKIEDLKNTPDTINVSGSSYAHDIGMNINSLMPYIIKYKCGDSVMESAEDYFYTNGYEVARDGFFNDVFLGYEINPDIDTKLFTRTIFNYIELQEDITNKIRANIPLVVKQKLSSIFNNGITLWTFLGFTSMYGDSVVNESATYNLDNWLFKHDLDNTEYKGETYAQ